MTGSRGIARGPDLFQLKRFRSIYRGFSDLKRFPMRLPFASLVRNIVVASLLLGAMASAGATTPRLLTTGSPGAILMRTDGHWYVKGTGDLFSTAPMYDNTFPHDQIVKFTPGQFVLLGNGDLWTQNTEVVGRLWNTAPTPGQWYKIASNIKDFVLASNFTTTSSSCGGSCPPAANFLYILTKDGHVQLGTQAGGFTEFLPGKTITAMVYATNATTAISTNPSHIANLHFFSADGAVYSSSSVDQAPFAFDSNGKMTALYNIFLYKSSSRFTPTAAMAAKPYVGLADATDHVDGGLVYLKTGEVLLATPGNVMSYAGSDDAYSGSTTTTYFTNLNSLLSLPAGSYKQIALADPTGIASTAATQAIQAVTTDGIVYARGTNTNCMLSLPGCPASSSSWVQVATNIASLSMISNYATLQNGTWYANTNLTIYYSGTASGGNAAQGAAIPSSHLVASKGFIMEPVDSLAAIPGPPKHVNATDGNIDNNVQLTWDPSVGATTYDVYASLTAGSKGILVQEVPAAQTSTMVWCDPARLPAPQAGQPAPTCSNAYYASADAITLLSGARDGRNIYFTVSAKNILGESTGNLSDVGYVNIPISASSVTIKADYNGSGSAIPAVVDQNQSDTFVVNLLSQPSVGGAVTVDPASNRITYTPANGFTGTDTFSYSVTDKGGTPLIATGTVAVACPQPVLTSLTLSPYPAIASGVAALKYTLASCAKNATLNLQLFNGAQPANVLASASSSAFKNIPFGTDQVINIPFSGVTSANYTAVATISDTVQNISTQTNFSMALLDMTRAYYELNSSNWSPHAVVEQMAVTLDAPGDKFCDLSTSQDEVQASLSQDKPLKCLLEWTSLPPGLSQKPKQTSPALVGSPTQTGTQQIAWTASVLRTNGDKVPYASGSKTFTSVAPLPPLLDLSSPTGQTATTFSVPSTGGFAAKLTVDAMNSGVHTTYTIDAGTAVQFDTIAGQGSRLIELAASPLWSQHTIDVKSAYSVLPSVFTEKVIQVLVVPTDRVRINLDVPAVGLNNATIPVNVHIGVQEKGPALVYDSQIAGQWTVRIAQVNADKTLRFLTDAVDMVNGAATVSVPAINSMTPPTLVAVADLKSPQPAFAQEIQSDPHTVAISKGTPLAGQIVASKTSSPAPISISVGVQMAAREDVAALGTTDFYLSVDGGVTWSQISNASEAKNSRITRNFAVGSFKVKGVFTNKFSGVTSESAPIDIVTFKAPLLSIEGPKVSFPGTDVVLNAVVRDGGTVKSGLQGGPIDETPVVEWQREDGTPTATGTSVTVSSDSPKTIHFIVRARLAISDPNDRASWVSFKTAVTFAAPATPKVRVAGPALLEVGKVGVFEASVQPPWGANPTNLEMDGEWTLPSGEKRSGTRLEWTPVDSDVSPTGEKRPVSYTAWVKRYDSAGATGSGSMGTKVWKYIWPTWTMKVARDTTYAPSKAKLTVVMDNPKLAWQYGAEPLTLTWNFSPNAVVVKTQAATAQLSLPQGATYPTSLTLADTRGNSTTVAQDLVAYDAPPFNIDVKMAPSNAMWRVPVKVNARASVTGGHPLDKVLGFTVMVDGTPVDNRAGAASFALPTSGDHQLTISMASKFGASASRTWTLTVVPNHPPSCDVTAKAISGTQFVGLIAACGDADGKVVGYRWAINGQAQGATGNRLTVDFAHVDSPAVVDMYCTDDSGDTTTVTKTISR
ncbi:Ig-like domain-containing protein [Duganella vulcania]|uniref:Tandem-95 repeat protein n=1 Tax=Duganella vulcania TaxID=2692166 RepID=A0A845GER7_9BURK|nr:Ig-like domain-containing protein [Duganella vulcania]MYM92794.1 hypothetical protein [Duganella vulcania]